MKCIIQIIRPINLAIVFIAVLLGSALCGKIDGISFVASISAAFILAGGNAINDYFDIDIDRIAHPQRALPSGKISPNTALYVAIILMFIGLMFSFLLPLECILLAILAILTLVLYSYKLSGYPFIGNISIASLSMFAVFYGALAAGDICHKALWAGIIAGLIHLPREIFKDIQDSDGDRAGGKKTLPLVWNARSTGVLGFILCVIAMIAMEIPFVFNFFGIYYGGISAIAFILCGMSAIFGMRGFPRHAQILLKVAMITGLVALWAEVCAN